MSRRLGLVPILLAALVWPALAEDRTPEQTLEKYLAALQSEDFAAAYDLVSVAMKRDRAGATKSRETWVKESQLLYQFSEFKLFAYKVFPAKIEGDKALVPNLLQSQDKFLNQLGVDEHELYTLVKEGGAWKVDSQEEVIDKPGIAKWFAKEGEKPAP